MVSIDILGKIKIIYVQTNPQVCVRVIVLQYSIFSEVFIVFIVQRYSPYMCLTLKKTKKLEEPSRRGTCSQAASKVEINVFKSQKISLDRTIKEHQFNCVPFLYIFNTLVSAVVSPVMGPDSVCPQNDSLHRCSKRVRANTAATVFYKLAFSFLKI